MGPFTKHNLDVVSFAAAFLFVLGVSSCGHPAFAGGDESQNRPHIAPRPKHHPVIILPVLPAPEQHVDVPLPPVVIPVEQSVPKRIWNCDDEVNRVLLGRDDLERTGCHKVPQFGHTAEPSSSEDVSPN